MTSNVGARELAARSVGFGDPMAGKGSDGDRAFEKFFSPEFRNRLDARLEFAALDPSVMGRIVEKFVRELATQLAAKKIRVELTDAAREVLAERGYDPAFGARPLSRVIEESVKRPLTEEILFGRLEGGGKVIVDGEGGEIVLRYPE